MLLAAVQLLPLLGEEPLVVVVKFVVLVEASLPFSIAVQRVSVHCHTVNECFVAAADHYQWPALEAQWMMLHCYYVVVSLALVCAGE